MANIQVNLEKWESTIQGIIGVNKFDPSGPPGSTTQEIVRAGRQFIITPEERNLLNSDKTIDPKNDPFKNGMLRPVIVADVAAEQEAAAAEIAEQASRASAPNPNHMSDSQLRDLFGIRNHMQFRKAVDGINSVQTLERLSVIAGSVDNATMSQNNVVVAALEAARDAEGGIEVVEVEQARRIGSAEEEDPSGVHPLKI